MHLLTCATSNVHTLQQMHKPASTLLNFMHTAIKHLIVSTAQADKNKQMTVIGHVTPDAGFRSGTHNCLNRAQIE